MWIHFPQGKFNILLVKKTRRYFPQFKTYKSLRLDFTGNYFFSMNGRRFFKNKVFRTKKLFLSLLNKRVARRFFEVNPTLLRKRKPTERGKLLLLRQSLKKLLVTLKEASIRRVVRLVNKKVRRLSNDIEKDFFQFFESRLDVSIWRVGFFPSVRFLRQAIRHSNVFVNGLLVKHFSYCLRAGDIITFSFSVF